MCRNQVIHLFFVPLLLFTGMVWFCYTGSLLPFSFQVSFFAAENRWRSRYLISVNKVTGSSQDLTKFGVPVPAFLIEHGEFNMGTRCHL